MTPLREIMPGIANELINRSREVGQEPPDFVIERFDRQSPADKPPPEPPR